MENLDKDAINIGAYEEILKQFEKIKTEAGLEPDEDYQKELEDILGLGFDDLEEEIYRSARTKIIEVELVNQDAVFPKYAYDSDSGFDLHSTESVGVPPQSRMLIGTGLKFNIKDGFEMQVRPKSGLALKQGLTVLNTPGTVDSGYDGEVKVIIYNSTHDTVYIEKGQKIAQACICPVVNGKWINPVEVSEISGKDRGDNGFGSTGIK